MAGCSSLRLNVYVNGLKTSLPSLSRPEARRKDTELDAGISLLMLVSCVCVEFCEKENGASNVLVVVYAD